MADIVRYIPDDRRAVDALYRRVFGNDSADASRLRWEWQYRHNPNNPGRHARHLDRARRPDARRAVRDDARAIAGARRRSRRVVGHGRHGRARAPATRHRRGALPHVGPQRRRLARPGPVRVVASAVSKAPLARARPDPLPGQAPHAPCAQAPELARAGEPGRLGADVAAREGHRPFAAASCRDGGSSGGSRRVHGTLGVAGATVRVRRAARRARI